MKRFKYDWLVYAILGLAFLVVGILICPAVNVINSQKVISAVIGVLLILYFAFFIMSNLDRFKNKNAELKIISSIEILVIIFLIVTSFLAVFDIYVLNAQITKNVSMIIGLAIWLRGIVNVVNEVYYQKTTKGGKFYKYFAIVLITIGTYCFFNIKITDETIAWIIAVIFALIGLFGIFLTFTFYPKKKKSEVTNTSEDKKE